MASFRTRSIPSFHAPKPGAAKPVKMPALKLPTMRTGAGPKLTTPRIAAVHGAAKPAGPRPYSSALAKAASTSSGTAAGVAPGRTGWRNQGRTTRPQQDSPLGFFNQ